MMELKPCPFCGRDGKMDEYVEFGFKIECTNQNCQASYMIGAVYDTAAEAIEAWNRRVSE